MKGIKIIMKRQKKIIASVLAAAFLIGGTTCYAGSAGSMLNPDQLYVSTAILGNTTGTYRFTSTNSKSSRYCVEAYLFTGKTSAKLPHVAKKYVMSADLKAHSEDVKVSRKNYTVAKASTYGNMKDHPKRDCIASTIISNQ